MLKAKLGKAHAGDPGDCTRKGFHEVFLLQRSDDGENTIGKCGWCNATGDLGWSLEQLDKLEAFVNSQETWDDDGAYSPGAYSPDAQAMRARVRASLLPFNEDMRRGLEFHRFRFLNPPGSQERQAEAAKRMGVS
jgi:hypothetical protein